MKQTKQQTDLTASGDQPRTGGVAESNWFSSVSQIPFCFTKKLFKLFTIFTHFANINKTRGCLYSSLSAARLATHCMQILRQQ